MKININDHRKIFAIQEEFSSLFPRLKIEFFRKASKAGGSPSKKLVKHISKTLGECRTIHTKGDVTLMPSMTVADLKQTMNDNFGLSLLVFRKSGNDWIETSKDGNYSLEEQNKIGDSK